MSNCGLNQISALSGTLDNRIRQTIDNERVIADTTIHLIIAGPTVQYIVAF